MVEKLPSVCFQSMNEALRDNGSGGNERSSIERKSKRLYRHSQTSQDAQHDAGVGKGIQLHHDSKAVKNGRFLMCFRVFLSIWIVLPNICFVRVTKQNV